jgi:uncharacterized protein YjbJ (UPF0337 family)
MRTIALVAAALAVAYTTGCKDRDRGDASADADTRVESTSEQATAEVREGAAKTEDAAEDAADKTENAAKDAGDKIDDAADDAGNAVEKAADETGISSYSYERRDAFREDVKERLAAMDKELADLGHAVNKDATEAYTKGVAEAKETRKAVARNVDRLTGATAANWDEVQSAVRTSLDSLSRQLRALRPDANPMGGAGPS